MINDNFTAQKGNFTAQGTFVTLYKSVSYKAKKNPYIILYYPIRIKYRKRKRKKAWGLFFPFSQNTSPKRNDISPDLIPGDRQQQSSKQGGATRASGPPRPKRAPWKQTRKQNISPA